MRKRYYPVSLWGLTKTPVKGAFTYDTKKEAIEDALHRQNTYGDSKFTGVVIKVSNINEAYEILDI